mmetsp:Transcript_43696/g.102574  ORF Transcript_43696/g.102574 Transcript_43696/m.102574 type:complete len:325 (-) Transcript_43696:1096-2070(-)
MRTSRPQAGVARLFSRPARLGSLCCPRACNSSPSTRPAATRATTPRARWAPCTFLFSSTDTLRPSSSPTRRPRSSCTPRGCARRHRAQRQLAQPQPPPRVGAGRWRWRCVWPLPPSSSAATCSASECQGCADQPPQSPQSPPRNRRARTRARPRSKPRAGLEVRSGVRVGRRATVRATTFYSTRTPPRSPCSSARAARTGCPTQCTGCTRCRPPQTPARPPPLPRRLPLHSSARSRFESATYRWTATCLRASSPLCSPGETRPRRSSSSAPWWTRSSPSRLSRSWRACCWLSWPGGCPPRASPSPTGRVRRMCRRMCRAARCCA